MSDSKLNKKFRDAVRTGSRGTARIIRSSLKKMHMWQKAGLVLCIVFWISSVILGALCRRTTDKLIDQNAAERWSEDGNYAQVSAFLAEGSGASEETVKAMYTGLMLDLQTDAIALSETQTENGARLIEESYCGMGSADLTVGTETVTVNAIGVGGDFFNFHPLEMIDGYYFADDDLMKDRVLLDDQTAWRLFGSPNIVGMTVTIGGTPHIIAGVFRQPRERFYKDSGIGSYLVYMSYDSLCKYTDASAAASESSGSQDSESLDSSGGDAFAPDAEPVRREKAAADPAVPHTAAYMPVDTEDLPGKKGTMSGTLGGLESDSGSDGSGDTGGEDTGEPLKEEESDLNDDPGGEDLGQNHSGSSKGSSGSAGDGEEEGQKEVVNRNRVTCYEVVIPNPVQNYAVRKVRSRLEQVPFPMELATIVDNTSRFEIFRLVTLLAQPGVRSMQVAPIRYPYWENVALAWEDVLIPYALLWLILRFSPILFLLWLVIWYATHKSWTVGGVVRDIQDRIYDRQSERIYGRRSGTGLPVEDSEAGTAEDDPEAALTEKAEADSDEKAAVTLPGSEDASENEDEALPAPEDASENGDEALPEPENASENEDEALPEPEDISENEDEPLPEPEDR